MDFHIELSDRGPTTMFQAPYLVPWMMQQAKFPSYYIQSSYFLKPTMQNTFKENPTTNSTYIPYPATNMYSQNPTTQG